MQSRHLAGKDTRQRAAGDNSPIPVAHTKSVPREAYGPRIRTAGGVAARSSLIGRLREKIRAIEQAPVSLAAPPVAETKGARHPACNASTGKETGSPPWTSGAEEVDHVLPGGGLDPAGLHEVRAHAYGDSWAALGFALALLGRRQRTRPKPSPLLWVFTERAAHEFGTPYGPGLASFGIDPASLLMVRVRRESDLAWALEEGIKSRALAAAFGQGNALPATLLRRLALAARTCRTPCLFVSGFRTGGFGPALTRWRVAGAPSAPHPFDPSAPGQPRWAVTLERCRHGPGSRNWLLEWGPQNQEAPTGRKDGEAWRGEAMTGSGIDTLITSPLEGEVGETGPGPGSPGGGWAASSSLKPPLPGPPPQGGRENGGPRGPRNHAPAGKENQEAWSADGTTGTRNKEAWRRVAPTGKESKEARSAPRVLPEASPRTGSGTTGKAREHDAYRFRLAAPLADRAADMDGGTKAAAAAAG